MYQVLGERCSLLHVAVGDMGDEIDKSSKRNDAIISHRGGRLEEYFALRLVGGVLVVEVSLV